jgi:hypothetical protein
MKEKDLTIQSLLYNNIPQEYVNLIQSGQNSIYNSLKSITVTSIQILNVFHCFSNLRLMHCYKNQMIKKDQKFFPF